MRNLLILATVLAVGLAGCVHIKTIPPDIAPTAARPQKFPATMAIYFTPRLANCEVIRKPDTMYGGMHKYHYHWGPALQAALTRSVESAYAQVAVVNGAPRSGEFERVIKFDLPQVDLVVQFVPGYLRQEARADATIQVNLEIMDGKTMKALRTLPVTAKGSSTKDASGFAAYASMQFTLAMEKAIQQLSEITSNLLIMGSAEPR